MITAAGFIDLSACTATFVKSFREKLKDDSAWPGAQTMLLRGAETDAAILKDWKSAKAVLNRIKSEAASLPMFSGKQATLGKAYVVSLKPRAFVPWRLADDPYTQNHIRLMVNMIPCPNALIISGGAAMNPPVGQVVAVSQQDLNSIANFGNYTSTWLCVDVRRPHED